MIIVVTGSRHWTNESQIKARLVELKIQYRHELTIVVGYDKIKKTPRGVDRMVYKWANALGINVKTEPADWENGRTFQLPSGKVVPMAGFDRNELMLDKYEPKLVVAFLADVKSNGTRHCIKEARKRDIEVEVHHEQI